MKKCDVCKEPSGEYSLCPNCFQLMQEGKVKKCNNCGKWYMPPALCECVKASDSFTTFEISQAKETEEPDYKPQGTSEEKKGGLPGCLTFLIIVMIIAAIIAIPFVIEDRKADDKTSAITKVTKTAPTLKCEQGEGLEAYKIIAEIEAKDDYDKVTVEIIVYRYDGVVMKKEYLTAVNVKKGERRQVSLTLTASELSNADNFQARIYDYE